MRATASITRKELSQTTRKGFGERRTAWERTDPDYTEKGDNYIKRKMKEIRDAERHAAEIRKQKESSKL